MPHLLVKISKQKEDTRYIYMGRKKKSLNLKTSFFLILSQKCLLHLSSFILWIPFYRGVCSYSIHLFYFIPKNDFGVSKISSVKTLDYFVNNIYIYIKLFIFLFFLPGSIQCSDFCSVKIMQISGNLIR